MREVWREIKDFEHYQVSNLGKIKNEQGKILKPAKSSGSGAPFVTLYDSGRSKTFGIARTVALAFVPKKEGMNRIKTIDGDNNNCREDNLKWYK